MLSKISLNIFQNSELLALLIASLCIIIALKLIYHLLHLKRNFYLISLTLIYGLFIFHDLGSTSLPVTYFDPVNQGAEIVLKVGQGFDDIITITGEGDNNANDGKYQIYNRGIEVYTSEDVNGPWDHLLTFEDKTFFKYNSHPIEMNNDRFVKLFFTNQNSILNEIWFMNNGETVKSTIVYTNIDMNEAAKIIDEQNVLKSERDYQDATYFDEIYHVRNAYEINNHQKLYTATHPLFGTRLIGLGAKIFGTNMFGFRFFGALFTTLTIPLIYFLLKEFFKKDNWPLFGATLFALDFMPFVTGRIGTLEPFSVFFIILMFKCYFKALKTSYAINFKKHLFWLGITAFAMSIAIITKWTAIYGAVGMGIIYIIMEGRHYLEAQKIDPNINEKTVNLILFSIILFVLMPIAIYFLSFINLRIYPEVPTSISEYLKQVFDYNLYSLEYHAGLTAPHPYSSRWYQWLFDIRPIWYYINRQGEIVQTISCFNNPLISISGTLAIIYLIYHTYKHKDLIGLLILIAYFSELVPWIFITRASFAYHYYPCLPLLILALVYVLSLFSQKKNIAKQIKIYLAMVLLCFVIYLPVISGFKTHKAYVNAITILPTWHFQ